MNYIVTVPLTVITIYSLKFLAKFIKTLLSDVNSVTNDHGGLIVADVLKEHGIKWIFTLCGGHISPILTGAEKKNIRIIDVRHEVNAVFAADAVARCAGSVVGVAAVTAGPGLTNTVTAVKNAQMAESPVLLLGGAAASITQGRGALQDIDQLNVFRPICKKVYSVRRVADIAPKLREAIYTARSGVPGPVFVEFPIDTLYPYYMVRKEMGINPKPRTLKHRIINLYLEYYLKYLFGNAFKSYNKTPMEPNVPLPQSRDISKAAQLLKTAKKPLILLGSQSMLPPVTPEKLATAVLNMNVPCYLGGMARGLLGRYSETQFRHNRREALSEADVIVLAGSVCDFRLSYGRSLNKRAKIISINRSRKTALQNSDMFWRPTLTIRADVASTLCHISEKLIATGSPSNYSDWREHLAQLETTKEEQNKKKAETVANIHLNPLKVLQCLESDGLSDKSVLVADGGDFVGSAAYILRPRSPFHWLDPGAFGTLGVGAGFALGVKLCRPDLDVWIVYGDGSVGYSIAEFDTFTRHDIGLIAVVGNDACWSQIAREQVPMFGTIVGCQLDFTSYEKVAEAFGGTGYLMGKDNEAQMKRIFAEALDTSRRGRPVLINCLIGRSDFRQGSISV